MATLRIDPALRGRTVLVVGLGKSGAAAVRFLARRGVSVRATEASTTPRALAQAAALTRLGVPVETGGHTEAFCSQAELVVTSPGVPKTSLPLVLARKKRLPVWSEIELAARHCSGRVIALTGSNGKTTTCHLIHRMLRAAGRKTVLCGNVGVSFLETLPKIDRRTTVVLELSSFQLEDSPSFRPDVAVFLNLSANHLDRHKTMARYARAKAGIFANQRKHDVLIANADDARVRRMAARARSRRVFFSRQGREADLAWNRGDVLVRQGGRAALYLAALRPRLLGEHNISNILAALCAARVLGIPKTAARKAVERFRTLEHRIEPIGQAGGVSFVNDSKSTTVESTRAALRAVRGPLVWIAGGRDKGSDFTRIEPPRHGPVCRVVLYGEARDKIADSWRRFRAVEKTAGFAEAVARAYRAARPGQTVLLSPMCTSFDQFGSYEERGEAFKACVRRLRLRTEATAARRGR